MNQPALEHWKSVVAQAKKFGHRVPWQYLAEAVARIEDLEQSIVAGRVDATTEVGKLKAGASRYIAFYDQHKEQGLSHRQILEKWREAKLRDA